MPTLLRTNLATNPSMETASGTVNVRTNLCANPNFEAVGSGYSAANQATFVRTASTAMSGAWVGRCTFNGTTILDSGVAFGPSFAPEASSTYMVSMDVLADATRSVKFSAQGTGVINQNSANIALTANVKQRISWSFTTTATAPADVALYLLRTDLALGIIDIDAVLIEKTTVVNTYFDGNTVAAGDFTYAWASVVNNSVSHQQAPVVSNYQSYWDDTKFSGYQSGTDPFTGNKFLRVNAKGSQTFLWGTTPAAAIPVTANKTVYISYYVRPSVTRLFRINAGWDGANPTVFGNFISATANIWTRISQSFTVPSNATLLTVYFNTETLSSAGDTYDIDGFLVEVSSELKPYFDGNTTDTAFKIFDWTGPINASTSTESSVLNKPAAEYSLADLKSATYLGNEYQFLEDAVGINNLSLADLQHLHFKTKSGLGNFYSLADHKNKVFIDNGGSEKAYYMKNFT